MTVEAPMWKSQSTITIPWKGNAEVTITELLSTTLDAARSVLVDVAKSGKKITYGELAKRSGTGYPAQSMGKVLDVLSLDCSDRGEPSLAPIVVRAATDEVADGYVGSPEDDRAALYQWWVTH
ncbi:hypothetical protein BS618_32625 [Rhodococcus erythropolis]|uniref:hypothetical protein n=1 Tax=Rhodococcus qingshengii TaxID=334542 RepID=UPI000936DA9F|nr:hypothetical protein [Rhodococcus qingshengii]MCZ4548175.1 hypothetical protein [Rhodococcus qingshengii]OKA07913.1 hypothetical protein BS618_32625 [Rhodococcus erythropolis]